MTRIIYLNKEIDMDKAFPFLPSLKLFSLGLLYLSTDEEFLPFIVDGKGDIVIDDLGNLKSAFKKMKEHCINIEITRYYRKRYLENFSLKQFEENFIRILKKQWSV